MLSHGIPWNISRVTIFCIHTTGSPSSVSVAFIRVCMGIFNNSFFGKNT
jgi:hypothetical protein